MKIRERRQSEHWLNLSENRCDVLQPVSPGNVSLEMNSSFLLSQTCSKEEGSCRIACLPHSSFTKSTNLKGDAVRESALKFGWKITIHQVLYELLQLEMKV